MMHPDLSKSLPEFVYFDDKRPDFGPRQVRSPEQLQVGKTYVHHFAVHIPQREGILRVEQEFSLIDGPRALRKGSERFVLILKEEEKIVTEMLLYRLGLGPSMRDGRWSKYDWLEDPQRARLN